MKNRLGSTEVVGLALLVLVVVAVTACGFLVRGCSDPAGPIGPGPEVTVLDTVTAPARTATKGAKARKAQTDKASKTSKKRKGSGAAKKKAAKKRLTPARQDPFADTVPLYR